MSQDGYIDFYDLLKELGVPDEVIDEIKELEK